MKKITWFLPLVLLLLLINPTQASLISAQPYSITGISGPELANVEKRLKELQHIKALNNYSPEELRTQIIHAIEPYGYLQVSCNILHVAKNTIQINVHLGPQTHITTISIQAIGPGAKQPKILKAIESRLIHEGDPLFIDKYNKSKQQIVNAAENLGYLRSQFKKAEILIDKSTNTARITLVFDTGPQYYFGQVQFDPTNIDPKLLHRFVPFKPGQAYSTEKILQLNNYLSGSGYFSSVQINPKITEDTATVPIQIQTRPAPKYTYSLGAGYGTDTGIRGRAGLHITPVNRKGHKFNAVAQGSSSQNVLQAQYIIPAKNPVTDQYSLTGNYSNLNYATGTSNSVLLSLAEQHNVRHFQRTLSINSLYERYNYFTQPATDQYLLYPKASLVFSRVKDKLFSPSGYTLTLTGLAASKSVLSDINASQAALDVKAALMINPLRLRLYGHSLQGITQTHDINRLPLSLALLLGGADNLKGYSFNSIGPGRIISYGGLELQKEMLKNWYLVGFYDLGTVYNPSPKNTLYDAGAGLMWVSPIGPIKAGLAQPITHRFGKLENSSPRLVVSMGPDL